MKKVITVIITIYLFFMFLTYSGVFMDKSNPIEVAAYYLECMRNRQGFLTYKFCEQECFDEDRRGIIYSRYKMHYIDSIKFSLSHIDSDKANVQANIAYKDTRVKTVIIGLRKTDNGWIVSSFKEIFKMPSINRSREAEVLWV